jgi:hypothetical protein
VGCAALTLCLCRMQDIGRIGYCVCARVCARSSLACRSGNRAAVTVSASGNGSLVSLASTNLLPAVCQLDWICPPGHACDSVALVKVRPYKPFSRLLRGCTGCPKFEALRAGSRERNSVSMVGLYCHCCATRSNALWEHLGSTGVAWTVPWDASAALLERQLAQRVHPPPHTRQLVPTRGHSVC